jgi:hypothetical protein
MRWLRGMVLCFRCAYVCTHTQAQILGGGLVIKHESCFVCVVRGGKVHMRVTMLVT